MTVMTRSCPVCPREELPEEALSCPSCGTDLTPLRRLQSLGRELERPPVSAPTPAGASAARARGGSALRTLLASGAGLAVGLACGVMIQLDPAPDGPVRASTPRQVPAAASSPAEAAPPPALREALDGDPRWRVKQTGGKTIVWFRDGLFPAGSAVPLPEGRAALAELAANLYRAVAQPETVGEQSAIPLRILVTGVTDSSRPGPASGWRDNVELGFARARAAARLLERPRGESKIRWLPASAGDGSPPYPNNTRENRARNRSVVLIITER